jgi:protein-tyrosine phosphatase
MSCGCALSFSWVSCRTPYSLSLDLKHVNNLPLCNEPANFASLLTCPLISFQNLVKYLVLLEWRSLEDITPQAAVAVWSFVPFTTTDSYY